MILTDGNTVSCSKGKINGADVAEYTVTGLKYIPVKVKQQIMMHSRRHLK